MLTRRSLFACALVAIALLTKTEPDSAHVQSRLGTVESIVERHTLQLDDSIFIGTRDKVLKDGHYYSHQPPLLSVIEAPIYALLRAPGTRFNNRGRGVMVYAFSLLTNGVALALTVVVFAEIFALAGVASPAREVVALLLPFGTWLLPYAIVTNNHGISALLTTACVWLLLKIEWQGSTPHRTLALGAVLGLLAAFEVLPLVAFIPPVVIYLWSRPDRNARSWSAFSAGVAAPLAVHAALNISIIGDVIPAGFHTELFQYEGSTFDADSLSGSLKYTSLAAAARYAWESMVAGKGFFTFAPICLLGLIAGVVSHRWWRQRAAGPYAVLMSAMTISLVIALLTTNNFGGEAVGFRHAVYLIPIFLVLLLPWLLDRVRLRLVISMAAISMVLMVLFAVRQPWSVLTVSAPRLGSWDQYLDLFGRVAHGNLFQP